MDLLNEPRLLTAFGYVGVARESQCSLVLATRSLVLVTSRARISGVVGTKCASCQQPKDICHHLHNQQCSCCNMHTSTIDKRKDTKEKKRHSITSVKSEERESRHEFNANATNNRKQEVRSRTSSQQHPISERGSYMHKPSGPIEDLGCELWKLNEWQCFDADDLKGQFHGMLSGFLGGSSPLRGAPPRVRK